MPSFLLVTIILLSFPDAKDDTALLLDSWIGQIDNEIFADEEIKVTGNSHRCYSSENHTIQPIKLCIFSGIGEST